MIAQRFISDSDLAVMTTLHDGSPCSLAFKINSTIHGAELHLGRRLNRAEATLIGDRIRGKTVAAAQPAQACRRPTAASSTAVSLAVTRRRELLSLAGVREPTPPATTLSDRAKELLSLARSGPKE